MATKNKQAEQQKDRRKHKESLSNHKHRELTLERNAPSMVERQTFLIVCEGENTEPSYFSQFRLSTATIHPIGEGYITDSLVKRAKELSEQKDYDQVWCVFDADPNPDNQIHSENFNKAIIKAQNYGFGIAYSNQAFEYWIILHFEDHQGGNMDRSDYNNKINALLNPFNLTYDGNGSKFITDEIFELLDGIDEITEKPRKILAINRAKRNYDFFDHSNPAREESSTTVFKLVEEIMKYI